MKPTALLAMYVGAWLVASSVAYWLCKRRVCRPPLLLYPAVVGIRVRRVATPRPGRAALALNVLCISLLVLSAALFYAVAGFSLWSRITGAPALGAFVPIVPGVTISFELFLYVLPGISTAIVIHELMHALVARLNGVRVRGFGLAAVAGLLPVAFVEVDDRELLRLPRLRRLAVYSAGVAGNALLAVAVMLVLTAMPSGVVIVDVAEGSPAHEAGLRPGMIVREVNGRPITSVVDLKSALANTTEAAFTLRYGDETVVVVVERGSAARYGIVVAEVPLPLVAALGPQAGLSAAVILGFVRDVNAAVAAVNAAPIFITDGARVLAEFVPARAAVAVSALTLALLLAALTL